MYRLYALHDYDEKLKRKGAFEINENQVEEFNKLGYGIYWTLNDYKGRRLAKNITKINYWIADIDEGTKGEQLDRINNLWLKPTLIVETKKGFHCYWEAVNATLENYKKIELGIIEKLKADKACKDPVRLLRMPYSYHQKDKNNPFLIQIVEQTGKVYTEEKMLYIFELKQEKKQPKLLDKNVNIFDESKWEELFHISRIGRGCRNNELFKCMMKMKDLGYNTEISTVINTINSRLSEPLPQYEVDAILRGKGILV